MPINLELILARSYKADALAYMDAHPEDFKKLVEIALSNHHHTNWRAAWLAFNCMEDNDLRLQPFIGRMVVLLPQLEEGHQRELLKILFRMQLGEDHESLLFDHCVGLWESVKKSPSLRYIAFRFMMRVAEHYPELRHEILVLTQPQYVNALSPGIKNSVNKMIRILEV